MKLSHSVAAHRRAMGIKLGFSREVSKPGAIAKVLVPEDKLPPYDPKARTVWVTRSRLGRQETGFDGLAIRSLQFRVLQ